MATKQCKKYQEVSFQAQNYVRCVTHRLLQKNIKPSKHGHVIVGLAQSSIVAILVVVLTTRRRRRRFQPRRRKHTRRLRIKSRVSYQRRCFGR